MMPPVPQCLACGTCCFSQLVSFARVSGADYARLGDDAERLVHFDGVHAYMRMVDGHCSALVVDESSRELVCSTYATRPQVCRDLERGSAACLAERDAKADRPLIALTKARPG